MKNIRIFIRKFSFFGGNFSVHFVAMFSKDTLKILGHKKTTKERFVLLNFIPLLLFNVEGGFSDNFEIIDFSAVDTH